MRTRNLVWPSVALGGALAAGVAGGAAPSSSSSSAAPSSSSSSPATSDDSVPVVSGVDIPREASPAPKAGEWAAARAVRINRGERGPCTASLVREWLRVRCPQWIGGGLVAGDPKGVQVTTTGDPFSDSMGPNGAQNRAVTTVVFPLQRGESKVFSFLQLAQEYASSAYAEGGTLSVVWRAGRADPVLIMTRLPEPPMF